MKPSKLKTEENHELWSLGDGRFAVIRYLGKNKFGCRSFREFVFDNEDEARGFLAGLIEAGH